jgi:hypothetical protein
MEKDPDCPASIQVLPKSDLQDIKRKRYREDAIFLQVTSINYKLDAKCPICSLTWIDYWFTRKIL